MEKDDYYNLLLDFNLTVYLQPALTFITLNTPVRVGNDVFGVESMWINDQMCCGVV
jgi:hypothetical protein